MPRLPEVQDDRSCRHLGRNIDHIGILPLLVHPEPRPLVAAQYYPRRPDSCGEVLTCLDRANLKVQPGMIVHVELYVFPIPDRTRRRI